MLIVWLLSCQLAKDLGLPDVHAVQGPQFLCRATWMQRYEDESGRIVHWHTEDGRVIVNDPDCGA